VLRPRLLLVTLARRITAEALATALLLCAVVGSGIMAERLAAGNIALALLANTFATGAALVALILTFGPISGAHMNPAVTLTAATEKPCHGAKPPLTSPRSSRARSPASQPRISCSAAPSSAPPDTSAPEARRCSASSSPLSVCWP
jgi:hypothetical protein